MASKINERRRRHWARCQEKGCTRYAYLWPLYGVRLCWPHWYSKETPATVTRVDNHPPEGMGEY